MTPTVIATGSLRRIQNIAAEAKANRIRPQSRRKKKTQAKRLPRWVVLVSRRTTGVSIPIAAIVSKIEANADAKFRMPNWLGPSRRAIQNDTAAVADSRIRVSASRMALLEATWSALMGFLANTSREGFSAH